jgi:hypothetical protein
MRRSGAGNVTLADRLAPDRAAGCQAARSASHTPGLRGRPGPMPNRARWARCAAGWPVVRRGRGHGRRHGRRIARCVPLARRHKAARSQLSSRSYGGLQARSSARPQPLCRQAQHVGILRHPTAPVDAVTPEIISGFVEQCRAAEYEVSNINRALQVLRGMRRLAVEWGRVEHTRRRRRRLGRRYWKRTRAPRKESEPPSVGRIQTNPRTRSECVTWPASCSIALSGPKNVTAWNGNRSAAARCIFPLEKPRMRGARFP